MSDIEKRLRELEDRQALYDVLHDYYSAVDTLSDMDKLLGAFTEDAVFDVSKLGLERYVGHEAIRGFFTGVFKDTKAHAHHVSNFQISHLGENDAKARGYVIGTAVGNTGAKVFVHCYYDIEYRRTDKGWKMAVFDEGSIMPLGEEVSDLHQR